MGFDLETRNANDRLVNAVRATESGITAVKTAVELGQMDGNNTRAIGDGQSLPTEPLDYPPQLICSPTQI